MKKNYFLFFCAIFFGTGILKAQWTETPLRTSMNSSYIITSLFYDGDVLWAGSRSTVYKSEDDGATWTNVTSGGINVLQTDVKDFIKLEDYVYVAFGGNGNRQIFRTNNNGQTWVIDTLNYMQFQYTTNLYTHKEYILAKLETNHVLFKTNADGQWTKLIVPDSRFNTPETIFSKGDTLVLTSGQGGPAMALTTDMGQTWTTRSTNWSNGIPANGDWVFGVWHGKSDQQQMAGTNRGFTTTPPLEYIYNFVKTNDGMETFGTVPFNSSGLVTMWIDGENWYAGFAGSGSDLTNRIKYSGDEGETWADITENMMDFVQFNHLPVSSIEVINGVAFVAGNQNGVLKYGETNSLANINDDNLTLYPNPSNDQIFIKGIETGSRIELMDLSGKLIMQTTANDSYQMLSIQDLSAGTYLVSVTYKGMQSIKKLVKE